MKENYSLFKPLLEDYLKKVKVCGCVRDNLEVSLSNVQEGNWKNLWREKAIYDLTAIIGVFKTTTMHVSEEVKIGRLVLEKKRGKLLVDLMTRYKTSGWEMPKLTLEDSFVVPLNAE